MVADSELIWAEICATRAKRRYRKRKLEAIKQYTHALQENPKRSCKMPAVAPVEEPVPYNHELERSVLITLCDPCLTFPLELQAVARATIETSKVSVAEADLLHVLQKLEAQALVRLCTERGNTTVEFANVDNIGALANYDDEATKPKKSVSAWRKIRFDKPGLMTEAIEALLAVQSEQEKSSKQLGTEILELLSKPTAKKQMLADRFKSEGGAQVQEFCTYGTKEDCSRERGHKAACSKVHFRKIIKPHTDVSLGDCSFLNTCFHMDTCKYIHYEIEFNTEKHKSESQPIIKPSTITWPPQWVKCDLRHLDVSVLGKFAVVMADPPWDIHMELPYGTMSDDEMRNLCVPKLQDDGYLFLWVTGRAMELGRECLRLWGYQRVEELVWVKTNQLQRIIRTGRTGHWLNHGKEHCLIGVKGNLAKTNPGLDCDVIVAEVRATSHKPDEVYGIIERLSPGTRKIELFGRPHNCQPNWITLGNQLDGVRLLDPDVVERFKKRYPDMDCMAPPEPPPPQAVPSNNTVILPGDPSSAVPPM